MNRSRHPWLDRLAAIDGLEDCERVWTFVAAHTAAGDLDGVARDFRHLEPGDQASGIEAILQTHLFAGYPRTINALGVVRAAGIAAGHEGEGAPGTWLPLGERSCRTIYGHAYEALRRRVASLHRDLDRWMVEIGYGRILSRPGLTLRQRELCAVAVLAGQDVAPQLESHILGAMHAGASRAECRAVLDQTALAWGETAQQQVDQVWEGL